MGGPAKLPPHHHPPWLPPPPPQPLYTDPPGPASGQQGHSHFAPHPQVPLTEVIEPLDFEEVLLSQPPDAEPGPLRDLVEFPADDLELLLQPRECRTTEPGVPEEGCVPLSSAACAWDSGSRPLGGSGSGFNSGPSCVALDKLTCHSEVPCLQL